MISTHAIRWLLWSQVSFQRLLCSVGLDYKPVNFTDAGCVAFNQGSCVFNDCGYGAIVARDFVFGHISSVGKFLHNPRITTPETIDCLVIVADGEDIS